MKKYIKNSIKKKMDFLKQIEASELKKNDHILLNEKTCKITEIAFSKTGKHGCLKATMFAVDIFSHKKHQYMCPGKTVVQKVSIRKQDFQVIDHIENESVISIMDSDAVVSEQKVPKEYLDIIKKNLADKIVYVTILSGVEGSGENLVHVQSVCGVKTE